MLRFELLIAPSSQYRKSSVSKRELLPCLSRAAGGKFTSRHALLCLHPRNQTCPTSMSVRDRIARLRAASEASNAPQGPPPSPAPVVEPRCCRGSCDESSAPPSGSAADAGAEEDAHHSHKSTDQDEFMASSSGWKLVRNSNSSCASGRASQADSMRSESGGTGGVTPRCERHRRGTRLTLHSSLFSADWLHRAGVAVPLLSLR